MKIRLRDSGDAYVTGLGLAWDATERPESASDRLADLKAAAGG